MSTNRLKFRAWDETLRRMMPWEEVRPMFGWCLSYHKVMQWTGLYDSDGAPVYEGDIIRHPGGDKAVIEYDFGHAGFRAVYDNHGSGLIPLQLGDRGLAVVVGNRHETPELLEA